MKLKKLIIVLGIVIVLTGCTKVDDLSIDSIITNFSYDASSANTFRKGYEFYLPKGIGLLKGGPNYAILTSNNIKYYLYVDLISYKDKKEITYKENNEAYFYQSFNYHDHTGYVEINLQENNQYLVEIMYNYAKIEVMVDKDLLNHVLINSINILNSIKYNDVIIANLLEDDNLDYTEEVFDIFKDVVDESDTLDFIEDTNSVNNNDDETVKDTDYID